MGFTINPGVIVEFGNQINHPSRIRIDNILITTLGGEAMKMALAAVMEVILVVFGPTKVEKKQCPLAMDKLL